MKAQPTNNFRFFRRLAPPDILGRGHVPERVLQQEWAVLKQEIGVGGALVWVQSREWRNIPVVLEEVPEAASELDLPAFLTRAP